MRTNGHTTAKGLDHTQEYGVRQPWGGTRVAGGWEEERRGQDSATTEQVLNRTQVHTARYGDQTCVFTGNSHRACAKSQQ